MIVSRIGELVDAILLHHSPFRVAGMLADEVLEAGQIGDQARSL